MNNQTNNLSRSERRALERAQNREDFNSGINIKKWLISILVISVFIGLTTLAVWQSQRPTQPLAPIELAPVTAADISLGGAEAPVTLIEYSDFECPACGAYYPIVKEVLNHFDDEELQFIYRHFPLNYHRGAKPTAYAAEAAGRQGEFWAMHDMIFENQANWSGSSVAQVEEIVFGYAIELGLDMDQFESDFSSQAIIEKVDNDLLSGQRARVSGTPSFFLNGEMINNPASVAEFIDLIEAELPETE